MIALGMGLGSIFLILALLVLVVLFISRPFFSREGLSPDIGSDQINSQRSIQLDERDRILHALQELDFDYALGKVPEETYAQQRALLLAKGVDVLRTLDSFQSPLKEPSSEITIAPRNGASTSARGISAVVAAPDDDLEIMLANRRRARQEKAVGFCPKCGGPVRKSDSYCPKCGKRIGQ